MPLATAAWAGVHKAFATYIEGDSPVYLTPCDPDGVATGGAAVAFNHDGLERKLEQTEGGGLALVRLKVTTRTRLVLRGCYSYDGKTWTVAEQLSHDVGTSQVVFHFELVRHAA